MLQEVERTVPCRMREIPMDLMDPYYAQFWPNGEMPIKRASDVGLNDLHGIPGALGDFRSFESRRSTSWVKTMPTALFAAACRGYREAHGLSMAEFARKIGVSVSHPYHVDNGRFETTQVATVNRWAQRLGLTVDELLAYADES